MNKCIFPFVIFSVLFAQGCGGDPSTPAKAPPAAAPAKAAASPPVVPQNAPLAPIGEVTTIELFVKNSVPVFPGTHVAIIDSAGPKVIVGDAVPSNVRWKITGPGQLPVYPAAGFITFSLAKNQWDAIEKATDVYIQPVVKTP